MPALCTYTMFLLNFISFSFYQLNAWLEGPRLLKIMEPRMRPNQNGKSFILLCLLILFVLKSVMNRVILVSYTFQNCGSTDKPHWIFIIFYPTFRGLSLFLSTTLIKRITLPIEEKHQTGIELCSTQVLTLKLTVFFAHTFPGWKRKLNILGENQLPSLPAGLWLHLVKTINRSVNDVNELWSRKWPNKSGEFVDRQSQGCLISV